MEKNKTAPVKDKVTFLDSLRRAFSTRKKKKPQGDGGLVTDATPFHTNNVGNDFETTVIVNSSDDIVSSPLSQMSSGIDSNKDDDDLYYKINDGREKIAIIFNHYSFQPRGGRTPSPRKGTDVDCKRIKKCLDKLGFKMPQVYQDPKLSQIRQVIDEVSSKTSSDVSCIAVVVMTHGNVKGILEAKDHMYPKSMLFDPFTSETTELGGVPKLFFIQACRGNEMDGGIETDGGGDGAAPKMPRYADLLVMYSTVENYVSWRDEDGSWMIQELCNQLDRVPCEWNILDLLTFVNNRVAKKYASNTRVDDNAKSLETHDKKQMPQLESTLTKLLNFSR